MIHRILTKLVVAGLFVLGDGALASEIYRSDAGFVVGNQIVQPGQSRALDVPGGLSNTAVLPPATGPAGPALAFQPPILSPQTLSTRFAFPAFHPRAPPNPTI